MNIYAAPRIVDRIEDCYFYHTMDIPGHGTVEGPWDLRNQADVYLGHENMKGKRVFEIGPASGFLTFEMEKRGAEVVSFELGKNEHPDFYAPPGFNLKHYLETDYKDMTHRLNNGYWLAHSAHASNARVVYGKLPNIPPEIGTFDVATFGSVLLHLRDPFTAMENVSRHITQTIIITDLYYRREVYAHLNRLISGGRHPFSFFLLDPKQAAPQATWWFIPPDLAERMLRLLGFKKRILTRHRQWYRGRPIKLYTLIADRIKI